MYIIDMQTPNNYIVLTSLLIDPIIEHRWIDKHGENYDM